MAPVIKVRGKMSEVLPAPVNRHITQSRNPTTLPFSFEWHSDTFLLSGIMPKSLHLLFSPNNWWYVRLSSLASGWWHYTSPWWGMAFLQHPVPVYLLSSSAISERSAHPAPLTMITEQARYTPRRPCGLLMMGENLIVNQTEAEALWTAAGPSNGIWIHRIQISSTILCYVNEQMITLGMWSPWQHPTYAHFTWKWEMWSQLRCFK